MNKTKQNKTKQKNNQNKKHFKVQEDLPKETKDEIKKKFGA